jgi:hypothetical protein
VLKIINVPCLLSGSKQAVLLVLHSCVPLTVLCIAQYYAVMIRGGGEQVHITGASQSKKALGSTC